MEKHFARQVILALDENIPFSQRSACKHDQVLIVFCILPMWSCTQNNLSQNYLPRSLNLIGSDQHHNFLKPLPVELLFTPVRKLSPLFLSPSPNSSPSPPLFSVFPVFPPSLSPPGEAYLSALSEITQFFQEETLEAPGNQEKERGRKKKEESMCVRQSPPSK